MSPSPAAPYTPRRGAQTTSNPGRQRRAPVTRVEERPTPITRPEYRLGRPPANAGRSFPAEVYPAREVLALLDALPKRGRHRRTGVRDRALFTLLWRSGLRIAEALDLELKDVDLDRGLVQVLRGKYRKRRPVPIDRRAAVILLDWLEVRRDLLAERADRAQANGAGPAHGPLFCVINGRTLGRPLGDSVVRETMKYWAGKAGWQRRAHPHALRHTFATELYYVEGAELADLQRALGHAHASTTDRYIHDLIPSPRLHRLMRDRAWPDQDSPFGHPASPPLAV